MAGLTATQTASNVASAFSAWTSFLQELVAYKDGTATQEQMVLSAGAFATAVTTLANDSTYAGAFAQLTGFASAAANIQDDLNAYQSASDIGDTGGQNQAMASIVNDASGIGGGLATVVQGVASQLGNDALVEMAGSVAESAGIVGGISALVGVGVSASNWLTNYLMQLDNALQNGAVEDDLEIQQLNMNDPAGDIELIMPGQQGDTLVQTTLGGNAFEYNEINSAGVQTSSVEFLAQNGTIDAEYISGNDVVTDSTGLQIVLTTAVDTTIDGNNDFVSVTGQNDTFTVVGGGNTITAGVDASGSTFTLEGTGIDVDTLNLAGATGITALLGNSTTEIDLGINSSLTVDSTQGGTVFGSTGDIATLSGDNITLDATGGQYNLIGNGEIVNSSNSDIDITAGSTASLTGGGNTVSVGAGSSITINPTDNNEIHDSVSGQVTTIDNGDISVSGNADVVTAGASNQITINADGSETVNVFNSDGAQTESAQFATDGTTTDSFYDPASGDLTAQNIVNADGSQSDYVYNSDGSETITVLNSNGQETAFGQVNADGSEVDSFYDPSTGALTGQNFYNTAGEETESIQLNSDGSSVQSFYDPNTGVLTGTNDINADGSQTDYVYNTDGSETVTVLNSNGQETAFGQVSADGSEVDSFYNPSTGALTGQNFYNTAGDETETIQFNSDGSSVDNFYDPNTGVQTGQNIVNADGSQTDYTYNADGSQSVVILNAAGQQTESAEINADGSQNDTFYNPSTGAVTEQDFYNTSNEETESIQYDTSSGPSTYTYFDPTTGDVTEALFNLSDGSSQEQYFTGLGSGETELIQNWSAANGAGTETSQITDFTSGNSQELFLTGLPTGYANVIENFSGSNATGTQTENVVNYTDGTSENQYLTGLPSGISYEAQDFSGANGTGALTYQLTDYTSGGSQELFLAGLPGGYSSVYENFTGAGGTGAQTQTLINFTDGTSEEQYMANLPSGISYEAQDFSGPDGTGALTGQLVDYSAGGSQELFLTGLPSGYSSVYEDFTGAGATGTQTESIINFTAGGSDVQYAAGLPSGIYFEEQNFTGADGTGVLNWQLQNFTSGGSQEAFFTDLPGGYTSEVENFTGAYGSGLMSSASITLSNGDFDDIQFDYNAQGEETSFQEWFYNAGGQQIGYGDYDPDGDPIGGGGYYGYGGYYGGGGYFGGYGFAARANGTKSSTSTDIGSIAQYDLHQGKHGAAAAAEDGLHQAEQARDGVAASGAGHAVLSGNRFAGEVITWSIASSPGTGAAPFSSYMGSQYEAEVQQAFAAWATASGITFEEVPDSAQSDIRVGFGNLNTASTGIAGYTSYRAADGQISPDSIILLEDPSQDALVTGSNGQLTYSGTDTTLAQTLLHEIGHALGLADDSDPASIMYYALGSSNRTLDSTDIAGIQALYGDATSAEGQGAGGSSAGSVAVASQVTQLIAAMSSFNPQVSGDTHLWREDQQQDDQQHPHLALAALAH